jgi:hypothetical protein
MPGVVGVVDGIAPIGAVALAIGEVFEDGRDLVALGVLRQPDPGGELGAVGKRDPDVIDLADRPRKAGDDANDGPRFVCRKYPVRRRPGSS